MIQLAHTVGRGSGYFGPSSVIFHPLIPQQPQLLLWGGDSAHPCLVPLEYTYSFVLQFDPLLIPSAFCGSHFQAFTALSAEVLSFIYFKYPLVLLTAFWLLYYRT